jgi:hypothetical protein
MELEGGRLLGGGSMSLDAAAALREEVELRSPEWVNAAGAAVSATTVAAGLVIEGTRRDGSDGALAIQSLFVQAANDFRDLLFDVATGRGRPAIRGARTLFELHVAALDVTGDEELAARWLDHYPASGVAEAELRLLEQRTLGNARRALVHRMNKLRRESAQEMKAASVRWGPGFARTWHPRNLKDRARAHGLDEHYAFYRFASAPVHGSMAAMRGLSREVRGTDVVRIGSAVSLAPVAALYGTWSMQRLVAVAETFVGGQLNTASLALERLDETWPEFYEEMVALDRDAWPAAPPDNAGALLVLTEQFRAEWYEYFPNQRRARRARSDHVVVHDPQMETYVGLREQELWTAESGAVGVFFHGAIVKDPGSGRWVDAQTLIEKAPLEIFENGEVGVPRELS